MQTLLQEPRFDFISAPDKAFILAFDAELTRRGFTCGGQIGSGYCWGRYMVIYTKTGVKSKKVFARLYLREQEIVLRLFLNGIDQHSGYIEQAPAHIREVFTGEHGKCKHCHNEKDGVCQFRKSYTLAGEFYEKCNGLTFEFFGPDQTRLADYLALFNEFYPTRKEREP